MLDRLIAYADAQDLVTEPGFLSKTVRWGITVAADGRFLGVTELGDTDDKKNRGRTFARCPHLSQPELKKGGSGTRHFLVDNAAVVALHTAAEPDAKDEAKHRYFVAQLRDASQAVERIGAIAECLDDPANLEKIRAELVAKKAKPTDNVTFKIYEDDDYLVTSPDWRDWWRSFRGALADDAKKAKETSANAMLSLITGEAVEPALTHPKITGLSDVGGLSMGDTLASYKQPSFRSYGLLQSANAAMSEESASQYATALNHLITHQSRRLSGVKVVYWYRKRIPPDDDPIAWLSQGAGEARKEESALRLARTLLDSLDKGERVDLRDNRYHSMTLSGASGRVMVRDWIEGRFGDLVRNIADWFDHLEIVARHGDGLASSPKLMAVLGALVRDLKDLPSPVEMKMWRVAVCGEAVPRQFAVQALLRMRSAVLKNDSILHAQVGLLKAFLIREGDQHMQAQLNEDHPSPAYQAGRLMAVLAALQYRALGDVGAGVVQRYYAAASTTPALVIGRLVRGSQFHLNKLEKPLRLWYERKIAEVMGRIEEIPSTLELKEQTLFALGYYQQIAHDRSPRSADTTDTTDTTTEETES